MEQLMQMVTIQYYKLTNEQKEIFETIPELPNCLELNCAHTEVKRLPDLPNCQKLYCGDTKIEKLPELPNCQIITCGCTLVKQLPELPSCQKLFCGDTPISWSTLSTNLLAFKYD